MPLSPKAEEVLKAIFAVGVDRGLAIGARLRLPIPDASGVFELCELLAIEPREEVLQNFLEKHPGFLSSLVGTPDNSDLAVLFKPPVGTQYRADFCVLSASQGGAVAYMFEVETSHDALFNKDGTPSRRLAGATRQIEDWKIWINRNRVHYAKELTRMAEALPAFGSTTSGKGYRLTSQDGEINNIWQAFGGFDEPYFSYTILIGRWSQLSMEEKTRVIARNKDTNDLLKIFTYEQLARLANLRLEREEWSDELNAWKTGAAD